MARNGGGKAKSSTGGGVIGKLFAGCVKMQVRNKVALFWALVFPLLFVLVFGLFYGGKNQTIGTVTIVDNARNPMSAILRKALEDTNSLKIETASYDVDGARQAIKDDKTGFVIIIPKDFQAGAATPTLTAVYSSGDVQVRSTVMSFLSEFVNQATLRKPPPRRPLFNIEGVGTTTNTVTFFDFVYAGILCLALMNYNLTGFAGQLTTYREQKILKRLQTTPLRVWKFMTAQISSFLVLNVLQIGVLLVVGVVLFGAHIYGNYAYMIILLILGALIFLAIGFLIASVAKTNSAASGMAVSISIVMMFLSGVFFPIQNLPGWIYNILRWLPLSPMITAMRNVALDSQSLASQWQYILIMAGWLVVTLVITSFTFKFSAD